MIHKNYNQCKKKMKKNKISNSHNKTKILII